MRERVIIRNSAKCLSCGDHIESVHRHDYVVCTCKSASEELAAKWEETQEKSGAWKHLTDSEIHLERCYNAEKNVTGIMVDGGKEYLRRGYAHISDYEDTSICEIPFDGFDLKIEYFEDEENDWKATIEWPDFSGLAGFGDDPSQAVYNLQRQWVETIYVSVKEEDKC